MALNTPLPLAKFDDEMALEAFTIISLVGSLLLILVSCEVFTNGIEWLGARLGLSETATGSLLAAVGTAMPETIIPIIAIFLGSEAHGEEIGEGAILGAPFMLGTLAMFIGGVAIMIAHRKGLRGGSLILQENHAERDLGYFMLAYTLALLTGLLGIQTVFDSSFVNYIVAAVLLVAYAFYVRRTLADKCTVDAAGCPPLHMGRLTGVDAGCSLGFKLIVFQVVVSMLGIILGAKIFVSGVETVSTAMGIPAMILAFLIAPIATELPEKFNSVIWYWRTKDTLALGNITGAMVFQSSIPVSIGLLFTEWHLAGINIASIAIALTAAAWMYYSVKIRKVVTYRTLIASGSLYLLYIVLLVVVGP